MLTLACTSSVFANLVGGAEGGVLFTFTVLSEVSVR